MKKYIDELMKIEKELHAFFPNIPAITLKIKALINDMEVYKKDDEKIVIEPQPVLPVSEV